MDYKTAERRLFSLINYEKTPNRGPKSLLSFLNLLSEFNHPQEKLKNTVVVKGTKGKGSTSMMLHTILNNENIFTGLFTSPHLFSVRERIKGNKSFISKTDFATIIGKIFQKLDSRKGFRTYFEVLTLLSIMYFVKKNLKASVFEAGLGGRLDATRLIPSNLHILTEIGFDHTKILGQTLFDISFEKLCGSENLTLVTNKQHPVAEYIISNISKKRNIKTITEGHDYRIIDVQYFSDHTEVLLDSTEVGKIHIYIPQIGRFLVKSAVLACIAAKLMGAKDCNLDGLFLPARFQMALNNPPVIIDGSHNPMSILNFKREMEFYFGHIKKGRILIFGMMKDKNIEESLRMLEDIFDVFIFVKADVPRSENPEFIYESFKKISSKPGFIMEKDRALEYAILNADLVAITGSFFVTGDFIKIMIQKGLYPRTELYSLVD